MNLSTIIFENDLIWLLVVVILVLGIIYLIKRV